MTSGYLSEQKIIKVHLNVFIESNRTLFLHCFLFLLVLSWTWGVFLYLPHQTWSCRAEVVRPANGCGLSKKRVILIYMTP